MTKSAPLFPPELLALDQQIGEFMEYWGFKRIHGRVWLHLYLSEAALDVAELMKRLKVSKALMSFCIREMKEYSVIFEEGVAKHGTILYRANPDLFQVVQSVLRSRERPMLGRIQAAHRLSLGLSDPEVKSHRIDRGRLRELGKMITGADRTLSMVIDLPLSDASTNDGLLNMLNFMGGKNPI